MLSRRFAVPSALLWLAVAGSAPAQQVCPVPPALPPCLSLAVGEVSEQTLQPGQVLCVEPGAQDQEFTVVPVNFVPTVGVAPTFLASDVVAVSGPPSPRPAAGDAPLAPLDKMVPAASHDADHTSAAAAAAADADIARLLASEPRERVLVSPGRGKFGPTPPQVDDLLDIQVAPGCTGALDMRKGRVESVSPVTPGQRRLYMVQEVVEQGGGWVPAVAGGFSRSDFDSIRQAYETPFTDPPPTYNVSTTSISAADARDVLANHFGQPTDIDGNGGTIVFFTRRLNEASPPASSAMILSRFEARDLLSAAPGSGCTRSNEGEIIYLAMPDPTGVVNSNVRTLSLILGGVIRQMAHQMTRLTNAGRRLYVTGAPELEQPWLDETLGWMSTELLFYRGSVGLTPRGNITLSNLTTGPYASRRVAAFNSFQNHLFGALRTYYMQASGGQYPGRYSVLTTTPADAPLWETSNERISYFYGVTASFLRYALDRANAGDAATLQALVDSPLTGVANLEAVFGADMRDWARDFGVAMYTDDNTFTVAAAFQTPSWHYRSVFGGLGGFPLSVVSLTSGVSYTPPLISGNAGLRWLRFGVASGTPGVAPTATFRYTHAPTAPITPLRVAVVRTK